MYVKQKSEDRRVSGELTEVLEKLKASSYIEEFVSVSPKNSSFSVPSPATGKRATKYKVQGINFNNENTNVVNFTALCRMNLDEDTPVHVRNLKRSREIMVIL